MRSRPPRTPSLSLTVAMTSPVGGSQAHPSCSHGTLGSEAGGYLALVPRSSSRSDLPAGQQEALRPGTWLRGAWGQLQIHPWGSRRQSLGGTGCGRWPVFPAPRLGHAGPGDRAGSPRGDAWHEQWGVSSLLSSQHPQELRSQRQWVQRRPVRAWAARPL